MLVPIPCQVSGKGQNCPIYVLVDLTDTTGDIRHVGPRASGVYTYKKKKEYNVMILIIFLIKSSIVWYGKIWRNFIFGASHFHSGLHLGFKCIQLVFIYQQTLESLIPYFPADEYFLWCVSSPSPQSLSNLCFQWRWLSCL